jgi:hypothetical protein
MRIGATGVRQPHVDKNGRKADEERRVIRPRARVTSMKRFVAPSNAACIQDVRSIGYPNADFLMHSYHVQAHMLS